MIFTISLLVLLMFADCSPASNYQSYSNDILKAQAFELSYRAHSSVFNDSFYLVPSNSTRATEGTLLKVEKQANTSAYTLAPNLSLSRFIYQSMTSNGTRVPVSGYILWPYIAQQYGNSDTLPMVIWAHGTSGVNAECAPSNIQNLWHHFQAPYSLALAGFVVVATDYAGLGVSQDGSGRKIIHEYANGPAQANDLFYSVPAARQAFPQLSEEYVVIGSSQGGGAAWAFAEKLVKQPMKGHLGTVSLSPFTHLLDLPLTEQIWPLLLLFLTPTLRERYVDFAPEQIFSPEGSQALETLENLNGCNTIAYQLNRPEYLREDWQNSPFFRDFAESTVNGGKELSGPILVIQGGADPIIYPPSVDVALNATIHNFPKSHIEYWVLPGVTHAPAMYAGQPIYIDWIKARFAGVPAASGYRRETPAEVRPAAAIQSEANWFVQKMTEPWQMT